MARLILSGGPDSPVCPPPAGRQPPTPTGPRVEQRKRDLPQPLCLDRVERPLAHPGLHLRVVGHGRRLVAVLEVVPAGARELRCHRRDQRRRRALLRGLGDEPAGLDHLRPVVLRRLRDVALQVGHDAAGHQRVGDDAVARPTPRGLDGEQRVRRLRLPVRGPRLVGALVEVQVVEHHRRVEVAAGAHRHDAGGPGRGHGVVQAECQGGMPEMVGRELALPPLRRADERAGHDAGVVDQQVQRLVPAPHEGCDAGPVHQIEVGHPHLLVARRRRDVTGYALARSGVADRQRDLGTRPGK